MRRTIRFFQNNPELLLLLFFASVLLGAWYELHKASHAWLATGLE